MSKESDLGRGAISSAGVWTEASRRQGLKSRTHKSAYLLAGLFAPANRKGPQAHLLNPEPCRLSDLCHIGSFPLKQVHHLYNGHTLPPLLSFLLATDVARSSGSLRKSNSFSDSMHCFLNSSTSAAFLHPVFPL